MKCKKALRPRFTLVSYIRAIYVQALSTSQRIDKIHFFFQALCVYEAQDNVTLMALKHGGYTKS